MDQRRGLGIWIAVAVLLVLGIVFVANTLYVVERRELAVVLEFGNPKKGHTEPGLNWKIPFIQKVVKLPRTIQFWGGTAANELPDLPTADGKKVEVIPWAMWRITDPTTFVKVLVTMDRADGIVEKVVRSAVRDIITKYDLVDLVRSTNRELTKSFRIDTSLPDPSGQVPTPVDESQSQVTVGREKILAEIKRSAMQRLARETEGTGTSTGGRGIELVDVGIAKIDFVPKVREATFNRLIAFMESQADYYEFEGQREKQEILNKTHADVQRIEGEGTKQSNEIRGNVEAEIIRDYAAAIEKSRDFYTFIRTLEAYKVSLAGDTQIIMTTNSDFLRLLKDIELTPDGTPGE